MERSILRAYLASSLLVGTSALALFIGCNSSPSGAGGDYQPATSGAGSASSGSSNASDWDSASAGASASANAGAGGVPACVPNPPAPPRDVASALAVPDGRRPCCAACTRWARRTTAVPRARARARTRAGASGAGGAGDAGDAGDAGGASDPGLTYAWVFVAPVADLSNSCGTKVGTHFAVPASDPPIPEWQYDVDGSNVTGQKLAAAPVDGSIPELLLKAIDHAGDGLFNQVTLRPAPGHHWRRGTTPR